MRCAISTATTIVRSRAATWCCLRRCRPASSISTISTSQRLGVSKTRVSSGQITQGGNTSYGGGGSSSEGRAALRHERSDRHVGADAQRLELLDRDRSRPEAHRRRRRRAQRRDQSPVGRDRRSRHAARAAGRARNGRRKEIHDYLIHDRGPRFPAPAFDYENATDGGVAGSRGAEASGDGPEHAPGLGVMKTGGVQDRERSQDFRVHTLPGNA